ncbi:hypothetical protein, partial [Enterobacter hormaechei]|uniref:hypothetical protein n=2 Tax=Enterobacter hormaechei TaxID=158836 RepID=UPI001EDC87CB
MGLPDMASALTNSNSIETDKHELESATIVSHDFFITFMVLFFTYHTASYEYEALMNPLMILVKIIKLRWIHILSYDQ